MFQFRKFRIGVKKKYQNYNKGSLKLQFSVKLKFFGHSFDKRKLIRAYYLVEDARGKLVI